MDRRGLDKAPRLFASLSPRAEASVRFASAQAAEAAKDACDAGQARSRKHEA